MERRTTSGKTASAWLTARMPKFPSLTDEAECDVCVVGAGIAGLTTAYRLAKAGKRVIVVTDGEIGSGETGRTTAHLSNEFDDRYEAMERMHGAEATRLLAESHTAAIDEIERIVKAERISCGFKRLDGYLFNPPEGSLTKLELELTAARKAGLAPEMVERVPIEFDTGAALRFPGQGRLHPLKYLAGLARAIKAAGGEIFTHTHVTAVEGGTPAVARTLHGGTVRAAAMVVATNTPISTRLAIHSKQAPYRSYVIGARIARGKVPDALYWDTEDPYHYVRLEERRGYTLLLVGGEDHKTGQADDMDARFARLEEWAKERFGIGKVELRWSGQVMEPVDGVAYIGRSPGKEGENVYLATGDSGMGMTHGTIAGLLIADLVLGVKNPWEELYDPSRIRLAAAGEYAKENLNVAAQYADLIGQADVGAYDEIARGEGAIIRRGGERIAAYRGKDGRVHELSATCTHLGCVVSWNGLEKSWDCPCHGSRFAPSGEVLHGPASAALKQVAPGKATEKGRAGAET